MLPDGHEWDGFALTERRAEKGDPGVMTFGITWAGFASAKDPDPCIACSVTDCNPGRNEAVAEP